MFFVFVCLFVCLLLFFDTTVFRTYSNTDEHDKYRRVLSIVVIFFLNQSMLLSRILSGSIVKAAETHRSSASVRRVPAESDSTPVDAGAMSQNVGLQGNTTR